MRINEKTGMLDCPFKVTLSDDSLIYSLRKGKRRDARQVSADIDAGIIGEQFAALVRNRNDEFRHEYRIVGEGKVGVAYQDVKPVSYDDPQYRLSDPRGTALLDLASRIGPLFGQYGMKFSLKDGTYREPISWWVQAAGVYRLAPILRQAVERSGEASLLDDEVIFRTLVNLNAREAAPNIDYGSEQIDIIEYALDDPLVPPYEYMMEIGEADRPRAFPSTIGKTKVSSGAQSTIVRGDYGSFVDLFERDEVLISSAEKCEHASGTGCLPRLEYVNRHRLQLRLDDLPNPGANFGEIASGKRIYAYRARTSLEAVESSDATVASAFRLYKQSPGGLSTIAFGNQCHYVDGTRRELYEDLYDTLVTMHTFRNSEDLRRGAIRAPFYSCVLEHIWFALGRNAVKTRPRFCPYCGRPIGLDRRSDAVFCNDDHRKRFDQRKRGKKINGVVEAVVRNVPPGRCFTLGEVIDAVDFYLSLNKGDDELVKKVLDAMVQQKGKKAANTDVRIRSLGGNGRGRRYRRL